MFLLKDYKHLAWRRYGVALVSIWTLILYDMENKDIQEFIHYITHSKRMTREQLRKRDYLLARDYTHSDIQQNRGNEVAKSHNPLIVVAFLHQFTENKTQALKYTTHYWDKNSEGKYVYNSFEEFKSEYMLILNGQSNRPISSIDGLTFENHLWHIVWNFLVSDDITEKWSNFQIEVGYNRFLKAWMDKNPNLQPFSMPLSFLPESMRPQLVDNKQLIYFSDVVNIFKRCIEFRDNDFYFTVKRIFSKNPDFKINLSSIETLRGRSFYTDTELVIEALRIIASNIFQRPKHPNLDIKCVLNESNQIISLIITQIGSYADKDVNDPKITALDESGDLCRIISRLRNLCDFSIVSRFRMENELKYLKIDYLSKHPMINIDNHSEKDCCGFSYILNFYIY